MPTILVVDDEALVRRTLRIQLEKVGFTFIEAEDGRAAVEIAAAKDIDIALVDILMPNMDGIELIRALRIRRPALPIVAMSGGGRLEASDMLDVAAKLGADITIAKPVGAKDIMKAINDLLAARNR